MRLPSTNPISLPYGATSPTPPYSITNKHAGSDYSYYSDPQKTRPNPDWIAPEKVLVTFVGVDGACGKVVDFKSVDGNRRYRACHNSNVVVKTGQTVEEGTMMGVMGATGEAKGAHLHLVMWVNNVRVDPNATIKLLMAKGDAMTQREAEKVVTYFYRLGTGDYPTPGQAAYWVPRVKDVPTGIDELGTAMLEAQENDAEYVKTEVYIKKGK